ncbi:MAG TPA: PAS domain-containing protein [Rhizomicrobium sp.]
MPAFLTGGGEMASRILAHDWSATLGPVADWPQSLKTAVGVAVHSPVPIVMLWGTDGVMLYNDAYSVFAGGRHPQLLGSKVREGWPEVADFNDNVMKVGLAGETLSYKDQELTLYRTGKPEQVWMNLDYSPIMDESGKPGGVIAIVVETTERVLAERSAALEKEHLVQSEQRLQVALSAGSGVGIWDWDVQADRVFADERFARLYGVPLDRALAGAPLAEFFAVIHPDDAKRIEAPIARALETGGEFSEEYRLIQPDGDVRWVLAQGKVKLDENGNALRFPGVSFDITARKKTEALLLASEAQFRGFAQAMPNQVWAATPKGQLDWFNDQTLQYSGLDFERLSVEGWASMVHPDDIGAAAAAWAAALASGKNYETEFRLRHADGVWRWHLARAVPVLDDAGTILRWIGTNTDIDDQKATAAALRELNVDLERKVIERTQARGLTWQVTPDLMGALNSQGYFETSNPAWQAMLGWSEDEVAHMSIFEMLHPDDLERTREGFALTQIGQPAIRFPNRYRCKDGSYRWISWVGVPEDGMVYCTGRDITEEREKEAELLLAQDALRQAQKMEAVGQLTGGIAHDFNNLLQGIIGSLDRVQHRIAAGRHGDVDRFLKAAVDAANRAAALTHRLLAFSRRQTLDPRPADVNRLIGGMEELIRRTMGPEIGVAVVGAAGLWPVRVDASQLENTLLNLCINARDAMPNGGKLTIETANKWMDARAARERELPEGEYVTLCVTDTGTGMSPEVIERAFDPFFTTKPLGQGTGLGLSMIYGFVRQSGGQVHVHSQIGKGTTMCLYFPRHSGNAEDGDDASVSGEAVEPGFGEVVLVVDDEATVRMLVTEVLLEAGYKTMEAPDGPAALRILQSGVRIDLLITDVGLPGGMNGRQVADAARELRKDLKILFITGFAENAAIGNGHLGAGMEILAKPFAMSTLGSKVREMLER